MNGLFLLLGLVAAAFIIAAAMRRTVRSKRRRKVKQVSLTPSLQVLLERLLDCSPESEMETLKSRRSIYNQAVSIYLIRLRGGVPKE
ncbi:MAG TPA: hypothetical protein EYN66_22735, partial [Myxococcales bacterium]|nr:hypothetical protein [Myxococcales bacterium]